MGFPSLFIRSVFLSLFLAGCAAKEEAVPPPTPPVPETKVTYAIDYALLEVTGVHLGMTPDDVLGVVDGACAPKGYYGGKVEGGVTELVCTVGGYEDRGVVRVGFGKPANGHRAWRVYYRRKGPNTRQAPLIREIIAKYGPPNGEQVPLEMWWREDHKNLRVIGDKDGLRVQIWDRSLNR